MCRSFLSPWYNEKGEAVFESRFNMGVVSLNLPNVALTAKRDGRDFWEVLDERLQLCYDALMCRYKHLLGTKAKVAPILWQYGALARLDADDVIDPLLKDGHASISLGYIGLYETCMIMTGESQTEPQGKEFGLKVMHKLRDACDKWKKETKIGFSLYSTPSENMCNRLCQLDKKEFGEIENITDKGYYTNSYHVDVRQHIDAFSKILEEAPYQKIANGGCISYVELPNMDKNIEAIETLIKFIYDNIQYCEFNLKSDYCMNCGFDGEIKLNDDNEWECPICHNKDQTKMNVVRRTCGLKS